MYGYHVTQNISSSIDVRPEELDNIEGGGEQLVIEIGDFLSDDIADNGVTDNHKEGSVQDINDTTKVNDTSIMAIALNDNGKGGHTPSQLYNKLTTSFQPLAEDISKHPELANLLHGFILKARKILCDKAPTQAKQSFLELLNSTETSFPTVLMSSTQKQQQQPYHRNYCRTHL